MAKTKRAPADGAATTGDLQASWPFPTPKPPPPEDRVRVDAIDLYTDPSKNVILRVPLEQLVESPFNPRTHYDAQALQDLADTVAKVGVMQAILARPLPEGSVPIYKNDKPVQVYEIVFGHRRFRAAKLAGVADVPVIERYLTDAQSAQLQAIENVQREDLDPIEEALGYEHYLKVHGVTKDQLADEVGLSRTHVYSRLKLLNAVPAVRAALQHKEIGSEVALLIARIPTAKLQEKALARIKAIGQDMEDGGKRSFRRIRDELRERFTLDIKAAMFDATDAHLVENAGTCAACPKRSGNAPEFTDIANEHEGPYGRSEKGLANLCTDPDCFEAKTKAHLAGKARELEAKGKTVVTGNKARAAIAADGSVKGAFIALKDVRGELQKKGKKAGVDVATVTIQNPRDGKTVEAIAIDALQAAGVKVKAQGGGGGHQANYEAQRARQESEHRKAQEKAAVDTKVNTALLAAVRHAAAGKALDTFTLQIIATAAVRGVEYTSRGLLAHLHDCKNAEQLEKKIGQMPADRLTTLLLDCALVDGVVRRMYGGNDQPTALLAAAKHLGVDAAEIRKDVAARAADVKTEDLLKEHEETVEEAG